jgi:DNA polymerase III delta prime subunit
LSDKVAEDISGLSRRNLRRAIMMLQTCALKNQGKPLANNIYIPCPEYESYTREIAKDVIAEQSPKQLKQIRSKLYDLLTKGITPDMIF